ncbi:hypothetical protein Tco_0342832, partial [Tanacetum coccineum]
ASCLAVLGAGGADVSPVGACSSSRSPLAITSPLTDILSHSHAPNIIFSLPNDIDFHCCDSGWRNVLFCHLTIEFLFRVFTQALIPLVGSFSE